MNRYRGLAITFVAFASASLGLPTTAEACPVCEYGSRDTALFIVTFFGFFVLGMTLFFIFFVKRGGLRVNPSVENSVLDAEGIQRNDHPQEKKGEQNE